LQQEVSALSHELSQRSVDPGDRVLLYAENSPHWVAGFFAVTSVGATVVPVNPKSPIEQIERLIGTAEPRLALHSMRCPWPVAGLPAVLLDPMPRRTRLSPAHPDARPASDSLAEIIFTSGTTGDPKGVMLSHGNILANLASVADAVPLDPTDHVLSLLPLFHVFGQMTGMFCPLRAGCAVTFLPVPTSRALLDALAAAPITHLVVIPEVLKTMMERIETRLGEAPAWLRPVLRRGIRRRISPTLRTIVCGGAPLDPELEQKWWELGFEVLQGYGLTETSPVVAANTSRAHRTGSVGKPVSGVEVMIAPDGEVLVRGNNVMQGYFRSPERTAEVFAGSWFRTGDGGRMDDDGFLHVFGRRKYMILGPSGENVFPEDIEAELNRQPGVLDSAVVGLARNGRMLIHATLLCDAAVAVNSVAEANRRLAPHQQIVSWSLWPDPDFPRSVTRKVKKEEVIRRLSIEAPAACVEGAAASPLRRLLADVTGTPLGRVTGSAQLVADLGLDSLLRIELVARIEEQFGKFIEEMQITATTTVEDLETLVGRDVRARTPGSPGARWSLSPWAARLRPLAQTLFFRSWIAPLCRLRVEGTHYLSREQGPVIFMANHRSYLDSAVATFALPPRQRYRLAIAAGTQVLYKRFRWAVPLGELALNAFPFPTDADENIRPGLDRIGYLLDHDWNVLIFPEGQMNRGNDTLQDLRGGTGMLAVEMAVPIVPIAIIGTDLVMPPDCLLPRRRADVTVIFGPPLRLEPRCSYREGTAAITAAMRRLLENN
jgi:long-chain acyl-CoA synthetase